MRILAPSFVRLLSTPTAKERKRILASMSGGPFTSKTTRPNRFLDLDIAIISAIRRLPMDKEVTVHDMAASDGITSLELFNRLSHERPVRLTASDYYDEICAARKGIFWVFFDKDQVVLQVALGAIALRSQRANEFLARLLSPSVTKLTSVSLFHPDVMPNEAPPEKPSPVSSTGRRAYGVGVDRFRKFGCHSSRSVDANISDDVPPHRSTNSSPRARHGAWLT